MAFLCTFSETSKLCLDSWKNDLFFSLWSVNKVQALDVVFYFHPTPNGIGDLWPLQSCTVRKLSHICVFGKLVCSWASVAEVGRPGLIQGCFWGGGDEVQSLRGTFSTEWQSHNVLLLVCYLSLLLELSAITAKNGK